MRNILMTVMLLVVVVLLFNSIISSEGGINDQIKKQGDNTTQAIENINLGK
jgi:uncharacterized membrane protein